MELNNCGRLSHSQHVIQKSSSHSVGKDTAFSRCFHNRSQLKSFNVKEQL
ncbi:hypothetical protein EXN66_Car009069 [Channa argus]|uniref:Uncharacterized protein n=1 Tax=Channa argus TaxID=215402 RepID=A0A6G1PT81_CHAAH|nr:hypothetical protein EXN66_Car009069 [Channa argus]